MINRLCLLSLCGCSGSLFLFCISAVLWLRRSLLWFLFLLFFLSRRILLWRFFMFAGLRRRAWLSFHTKAPLDTAKEFVDSGGSRRLGFILCRLLQCWGRFLILFGFRSGFLLIFKNGQFSQFCVGFSIWFPSLLLVFEQLGHHFLVDRLLDPRVKLEERNLLFQSLLVQHIVLDLRDKIHMRAVYLDWLAS